MKRKDKYIVAWTTKTGTMSHREFWIGFSSEKKAKKHYDSLISKENEEALLVVGVRMASVSNYFENPTMKT